MAGARLPPAVWSRNTEAPAARAIVFFPTPTVMIAGTRRLQSPPRPARTTEMIASTAPPPLSCGFSRSRHTAAPEPLRRVVAAISSDE